MTMQQNKTITDIRDLIAPSLYPVHTALRKEKYTFYELPGGRGSTKSSFAALEIVNGLIRDPQANAVVLRKVDNTVAKSVYTRMKWAVRQFKAEAYWRFTSSPHTATYLPTGQKIYFIGLDDPEKAKGINFEFGYCKYLWVEELTEFTEEEIRSVIQTLMRGDGGKTSVIYTYNPPKSVQAWVNVNSNIKREDRLLFRSTYLGVPRKWLGEQFYIEAEHLKSVNPEAYEHEYLGAIVGTGGEVFKNVKGQEITDEQIASFDIIRRGIDPGYATSAFAFTEAHHDIKRRRLYIYREIHAIELNNRDAVRMIKEMLNGNNSVDIVMDSAEPRTINEFREMGLYRIRGARKGPDSVNHGIKFLQDLEAIYIDPARCPNTYREFCQYELEKDKNGNFKPNFPNKNDHQISALRYALEDDMLNSRIRFK
jgi:phage terminase large subunit